MGQLDGPRPDSGRRVWRKCLGAGYFGRLVDFNTAEVRPGRLLVQEGEFGYAVLGLGAGAAAILRWLDRPGQSLALDQAAQIHPDVPDWVRKLDVPELRRLATLEALAGPEWASGAFWRYNHNHWPAGSPGGQGGEFAPRGSSVDTDEVTDLANLPPDAWHETAATGTTATATASKPFEYLPPVGKWRYFDTPATMQEWDEFQTMAGIFPGASDAFVYSMTMTFAAEGGMTTASNGRIAGLNPVDIDYAEQDTDNDGFLLYPNLSDGSPFTAAKAAEVYLSMMNSNLHPVGGVLPALNEIGSKHPAAALFDVFFRFGSRGGAWIVQRAINATTGRITVPVDSAMGPKTLAAYAALARDPATCRPLLDAVARERKAWVDTYNKENQGHRKITLDKNRVQFFRFLRHP